MNFGDSSALIPLVVKENVSQAVHDPLEHDHAISVWWGTEVECHSALARLEREKKLTAAEFSAAEAHLTNLAAHWHEVSPTLDVRDDRLREAAARQGFVRILPDQS